MRGGGKRWVMYLNKNKNENINIHTKTQRCAPFPWYIKVKSENTVDGSASKMFCDYAV